MIVPTLTALAVIFTFSAQLPATLQAADVSMPESEIEAAATTAAPIEAVFVEAEPVVIQPETSPAEGAEVIFVAEPAILTPTDPMPEDTPLVRAEIAPLSEAEREATLRGVEVALSQAKTVTGRFTQSNADGTVMTGAFALRRPGRMRFAYDAPTPILIVSDGATVAMQDSELETVDRYPLASTPLGLILDENLDFSSDVDVLRVMRNQDKVLIAVEDADGEIEGELTMIFSPDTYDLLGWITVNADLQITRVELGDVETNVRIDPRQFRLDEDEDEEDER